MSLTRHSRRIQGIAAALLLTHLLAACSMWVPTTTPLPTLVAEKHPSKVRLDLTDGTHVELAWPVMVGDSTVGSDSSVVQPVDVRDVTKVQVREVSGVKTIGLAVVIPMTVFAIIFAELYEGD